METNNDKIKELTVMVYFLCIIFMIFVSVSGQKIFELSITTKSFEKMVSAVHSVNNRILFELEKHEGHVHQRHEKDRVIYVK